MPIYEYRCPDCGHEFEQMRRMSAPPLTECPECAENNVRKLISRTSFQLKGGGWYSDHYGLKGGGGSADSSSTPAESSAPAATPSASDSGGGGSTDSAASSASTSSTSSTSSDS